MNSDTPLEQVAALAEKWRREVQGVYGYGPTGVAVRKCAEQLSALLTALESTPAQEKVVVTQEMLDSADEAFADVYDGVSNNRRAAIANAICAALSARTAPAEGEQAAISAGDAVFSFAALLTSLPHVVPFGAAAWATPGVDLATAFNAANGLTVSRDFPQGLKFPEIEGDLLDRIKQASTPATTAPVVGGVVWLEEIRDVAPRALELADRLVASGPKAAHVSASECHEISDFVRGVVALIDTARPAKAEGDVPDELIALLPGVYYMDPPDGGDVSVVEQFRRMAKDAARYRFLRDQASPDGDEHPYVGGDRQTSWGRFVCEHVAGDELDAAADSVMGVNTARTVSRGDNFGCAPVPESEQDAIDAAAGLAKVTLRLPVDLLGVIDHRAGQQGIVRNAYLRSHLAETHSDVSRGDA